MTIDYISRTENMTMECDICQETAEFEGTFKECIELAKQAGWIISFHNDEFYHFCSNECRRKL